VPISEKTVRTDAFPRPPVSFPGGVIAQPDVEYANLVGYRPQLLDLYRTAEGPPRPLVIYIHGGGWSRGDSRGNGAITDFPALLAELAARGYVVASLNYRLSGEAKFPAQLQDVKAAIRFLRVNAGQYGIDPTRVVLWGGSAGGHLAALAAATCGVAAFDPLPSTGRLARSAAKEATIPNVSDCASAAVIWYGLFDLVPTVAAGDANPLDLLGCKPDACTDLAKQASPITYVGAKTPPMLLIHGLADTEVSADQSKAMAAHLKKAGASVETLYIPEVDHGFIGKTLESTRTATHDALQKTFDYIAKVTR
jgi:acetyl esterase/lipase